MARYRFDVDKCSYTMANGSRQWKVLESTSVHISAAKMDKAWESFEKKFDLPEQDNIVYTFNCVTDNVKKETKDVKQKAKNGGSKKTVSSNGTNRNSKKRSK